MGDNSATTQPLLNGHVRVSSNLSSETVEEFLGYDPVPIRWWPMLVCWESKLLWYLSGPSIAVSIFNFMICLVTQMFSGRLGPLELAGSSIGIQTVAFGIMFGMASAVQTVCGVAYGARNYAAIGIVCQRAIILQFGASLLLSFLYWYSGTILRAAGQSDGVAALGQIFARGLIPQLYANAIYLPMQRFLLAQNIVNPLAYMSAGIFFLHMLLTWLAMDILKFGLLGAALILSLSSWLLVLVTVLYIILSPSCKETWTGLSTKAFNGLWSFFKVTLASAVMLCLSIWYNQGIVIISGLLPNPTIALDSISICMNYLNWDMQFMFGIGTAAGIRVGNELGAGNPKIARFSVIVVTATSILIGIALSAFVVICQTMLTSAFTSNDTIIAAVSDLSPLLAISVFLNGIQPILLGVAIGSGWQAVVANVNLVTYYIIGLPIGCVLGFKTSLGVVGIWWGMIFGVFLQTLILIILTARTNWNKEVERVAECLKISVVEEEQESVEKIT